MEVVPIKRPPSDLAKQLRALADKVEKGDITDAVIACCDRGDYEFIYAASLHSCLIMAAVLQQNCIDRMRK